MELCEFLIQRQEDNRVLSIWINASSKRSNILYVLIRLLKKFKA